MFISARTWVYEEPRTKEAYAEMVEQIERAKKWHDAIQSKLVARKIGGKLLIAQKPIIKDGLVVKVRYELPSFTFRDGDACLLKREDGLDETAPHLPTMMMLVADVDYDSLPTQAEIWSGAFSMALDAAGAFRI